MDIPSVLRDLDSLVAPNQTEKQLEQVFIDKCRISNNLWTELLRTHQDKVRMNSPFSDEPWWTYHLTVISNLLRLKDLLTVANEKESLMSVSQQKTLKAAVEIVVVIGIVNHLPQGIGITLKQRSTLVKGVLIEATPQQKCYSLCLTAECLMCLRDDDTFKALLSKQHLGDLMAAFFALLFPSDDFEVPSDLRPQLKTSLETLVEKEFQPNVVKELMLLHGNPHCPAKVARAFRGFLTDRLMQRVGVVATIKAILDLTQGLSSPQHWKTVGTLSKLITTPHIKDVEAYKTKVYPQILQLIYANEVEFMQVAVACVRQLLEKDEQSCRKWFLNEISRHLLEPSSEEEVSQSLEALHNCCGIPCSENWALPLNAFRSVHVNLFRLHCKVHTSVYHLKSKVADLVSAIARNCDPLETYERFLFENGSILFSFGPNGGIQGERGEEEVDWDVAPDLLLDTILALGADIKCKYFEVALSTITEESFERKIVGAKLLSELANDDQVQTSVNRNPTPVIKFVSELLKSNEQDVELACLGLMVITALLDDPKYKQSRDWSAFQLLVEPLKSFREKTKNTEVRVLAEQLRNTILSHGVVTPTTKDNEKKVKLKSNLDEAMAEAVDKLLPVRAHGLMSLSRLIARKDKETYAKRDVLLCLFKENLREDDSYVYLAAVEGLATLAAAYPDEVLTTLTEEYRTNVKNPEMRLKVGETLIKIVRLLNEMAVVYKGELVGAYLRGCLDNDNLVRASSLSNLGELCKILGFRVHAYLVDIFQLLSNVVATDKSPEPRRAAVMVVTLLLQGLGKETFSTLQDLVLELYRSLKTILRTDKDDVTKLHAELALQELNSCTVNFLMPSPKMEKRIFVLDPPSKF